MSDKYIVKNCPAILRMTKVCDAYRTTRDNPELCKNITYCVMKQIVENLKQVAYACHCDNCDGCGYYSGCSDTECGTYQALKSLELLNTQEVE